MSAVSLTEAKVGEEEICGYIRICQDVQDMFQIHVRATVALHM